MGPRDLAANVNFFSRVTVDGDGNMKLSPGNSKAGDVVELRAEMNVLVILNTCQHPLDPSPKYAAEAGATGDPASAAAGGGRSVPRVAAGKRPGLHPDGKVLPLGGRYERNENRGKRTGSAGRGLPAGGPGGRAVDPRNSPRGSISASWICTGTRRWTRCFTTRTITRTATARRTRSARRATSISRRARG